MKELADLTKKRVQFAKDELKRVLRERLESRIKFVNDTVEAARESRG